MGEEDEAMEVEVGKKSNRKMHKNNGSYMRQEMWNVRYIQLASWSIFVNWTFIECTLRIGKFNSSESQSTKYIQKEEEDEGKK